ncbi:MAG: zinc ABC transporter substrate-binding protein [Candidatus Rokubacteria bacterium]|nr:zinc ABC transporter substrate-binding protein [Candidatus Rokubacteria bacterium]
MIVRLMLALLLSGCSQAVTPTALEVVATVYPVAEVARWVGGDRTRLTLLVPPGVEAHSWEPNPQDVAQLRRARLFLYNGVGLEPWVSRLVDGSPASLHRVEATMGLDLIRRDGQPDPHVWLDPLLIAQEVETIRSAFAQANPADATTYDANARAARVRLEALDRRFRDGLAKCQRREVVVSHDAFSYLARRYRLTLITLAGLTPEVEPSPTQLAHLVKAARRANARTVFVESLVSPRLAETLARELGAEVRVLNPIEGLTEAEAREGKDYWKLMEANLEALRAGLGCA